MFILVYLLMVVLLGLACVPIILLASVCGFLGRRTGRNTYVVTTLLIAVALVPLVGAWTLLRNDPEERLMFGFGVTFEPCKVAKYRYTLAGLGDTVEYWRLKYANPTDCMQVISDHNLTPIIADSSFSTGSMRGCPSWWPKSTQGYSVFEGLDD